MNEKFRSLSPEKQKVILNAAFRVFACNDYRHAPMQEIANEAGVSKSLLFHYFKNKKELYLHLWTVCMEKTSARIRESGSFEGSSLFDLMERGLKAKIQIIREDPDLAMFTLRSFFERDPEIQPEIQAIYGGVMASQYQYCLSSLDLSDLRKDLDPMRIIQEMVFSSEGFLWHAVCDERSLAELEPNRSLAELEPNMEELLQFWKKVYQVPDVSDQKEQEYTERIYGTRKAQIRARTESTESTESTETEKEQTGEERWMH